VLHAFINAIHAKMVQLAKLVKEVIDKMNQIIVIASWVFMIQEIKLIVLLVFINVRLAK
jgi:hypothetical protein